MAEVKNVKVNTETNTADKGEQKPVAKTDKKAEKKVETTDRNGTPIMSFQDLDEPNENLPGVVAPKEG